MTQYCIIEDENGCKVIEHADSETAEEAAHRTGVRVIDSGPYHTWEEATEAMEALQLELEEDSRADTPDNNPLEGRSESRD